VKESIETVKVEIEIPKAIVDFLKHHENSIGSLEEYLTYNIISCVESDLDGSGSGPFFKVDHEIKRLGLETVFKKFGLTRNE